MSKQVDQRVVEMRFDNKQFEKNVSTTMSTLDKLKQKLHFDGASKGLEDVNAAAKRVDMSGLANGVETVRARFSALEVMGVTALANITNSAVNAGKRMISALTIAPVSDGFSEYEMTLNAVQTTMAGTGKTAKEVEAQLKKLDNYADKTVYSSADMFNNLPKFTNAGVELEKATTAMIGIANATAYAGGDARQASIAFYNLGQAIGTGYLSRMDYNSINNAGIATMEWKNRMIEAAIAQGTLTKAGEDAYVAGNKTYTLQQLFIDGLQEQWATTDVMMKVFGDYGDETTDIGKKAQAAAQDVKTFSQMMESLKATAGTGWKDTWQLIFGGLDEAKEFWTGISNFIGNILTKMSDFRNKLLEGALGKRFTDLSKKISGIVEPAKGAVKAVKDLGDIVNKVIVGSFGNGEERVKTLTKAGYNYYDVQNKVNEALGNSFRYTQKQIDLQNQHMGIQTKATDTQNELVKSDAERIEKLTELSDAELKSLGYTEKQIEALREVKKEADKLGIPVQEFIDKIDELNGRSLIIESFKNIAKGLGAALNSIKDAWVNVFPPKSMEEKQEGLYNIIAAFHKFSMAFKNFADEADKEGSNANKLKRTFEGLFTIVKMVATLVGGPLKIAFKIITSILGAFNLNILDVTASVGDAIVGFKKWIDSVLDFSNIFKNIGNTVKGCYDAIRKWFDTLKESKNLPKDIADGIINGLGKAISFVGSLFGKLGTSIVNGFNDVPGNLIKGFANGIWGGIKTVGQVMVELGKIILEKFREVLGIHSPSTETYSDGQNYMLGFWNGLQSFASTIWDYIKAFGSKCAEILGKINWGELFSAGAISSILLTARRFSKAAESFGVAATSATAPLQGIGNVLNSVSSVIGQSAESIQKILKKSAKVVNNFAKVVKGFSKVLNATALEINTRAIRNLAISIAILAGVIIVLTFFDTGKLWQSVAVVVALAGILIALAIATDRLSKVSISLKGDEKGIQGLGRSLVGIAASLLLVALAVRLIGAMGLEQLAKGITGLFLIGYLIVGLIAATRLAGNAKRIEAAGKMILKIGEAMLLLVLVIRILGRMDYETLVKGIVATVYLAGIIVGLIAATRLAGNGKRAEAAGKMILKVATAMLLMTAVVGILGKMKFETLAKGIIATIFLAGIITGLIAATNLAGNGARTKQAAKMILSVGAAMLLMGLTVQLLGSINTGSLAKGIIATIFLGGIITGLIAATRLAGNGRRTEAAAKMVLKLSLAIAILAGIAVLLGFVPLANLAKGVIAVAILGGIMALMIASTKGAKKCVANLIVMTVAIGVMALAVAGLSMIKPRKLIPATLCLALVMGMFALMEKCAKRSKGAVLTIAILAVVVAALGGILWLLSGLPAESTIGAAVSLSVLLLAMTGVIKILAKIGPKAFKATAGVIMLLAMAIPLLAFVGVLAVMQNVQIAMNSIIALSALCYAMTGVIFILSKIGPKAFKALAGVLALTAMAIPLLAFVGVLYLMQGVQNTINNVIALSILTAAMTGVIVVLSLIGTKAVKALVGVLALTALAIPLLAIVGVLYLMQGVQNATANATALATLLLVMAGVMAILALVGPLAMIGVKAIGALTLLIVGIGALAIAIGALMEAFPQLEEFLDKGIPILEKMAYAVGSLIGNLIKGFADTVMSILPNLGLQLSLFMINATPFIVGARMVDQQVLAGVGILAASILALTVADLIAGITQLLPFVPTLADLGTQLSMFMLNALPFIMMASTINPTMLEGVRSLAETILILTGASLLDGISRFLGGGSGFERLGAELIPFGEGIVGFSNVVSGIQNTEAVYAAIEVAKAIADMTNTIPNEGGVAGWLGGSHGDGVAQFAQNLIPLGAGILGFALAVSGIQNTEAVYAAIEVARCISDMTNTIPNEGGVAGWFGGSHANAVSAFAGNLKPLGDGIKDFADSVSGIENTEAVYAAIEVAKCISDMTNTIPNEGGVAGWFGGSHSSAVSDFADNLDDLGDGIKDFADSVSGIQNVAAVKAAIDVAKCISDMTNTIPNEGGVAGWFGGSNANAVSAFAGNLKPLGEGIKNFADQVKDIKAVNVTAAATAAQAIVDVSNNVPKEGGLQSWFGGSNAEGLSSFAGNLEGLGKGMKAFSDQVKDIKPAMVKAASGALQTIVNVANTIPKEGGVAGWFNGSDSSGVSAFAGNLKTLGGGIKSFYDQLKDINLFDLEWCINDISDLLDAIKVVPENTDNVGKFGKNLKSFGENAKSYATNMSAIASDSLKTAETNIASINEATNKIESSKISAAAKAISSMVETIKSMDDVDYWSTTGFVDAINNLGNTSVDSLITNFEDRKPEIKEMGKALITEFITGVNGENENVKQSGSDSVDNFITGVDNKKSSTGTKFTELAGHCIKMLEATWLSFYDAGKYLVEGFCAGINGNTYKAEASAKAMAKAADEAARKELGEHSPSKVFYKIGDYAGLGFINALNDYQDKSRKAGSEIANSARRGLSDAIHKIDSIITNDIDAQPTIRPVIDLDDIKSGTNSINSMLNSVSSPMVSANVNAINSMMNQRNQNGVNGDVISAINDLRKDLGNIGRPTYNVNGITYDDGSNVSNAVKDLIRAARIERRR